MDPTPDKDEPESTPPKRDSAEMSPEEREIWGADDGMDLDEVDDLDDLGELEDLEATPPGGALPEKNKRAEEAEAQAEPEDGENLEDLEEEEEPAAEVPADADEPFDELEDLEPLEEEDVPEAKLKVPEGDPLDEDLEDEDLDNDSLDDVDLDDDEEEEADLEEGEAPEDDSVPAEESSSAATPAPAPAPGKRASRLSRKDFIWLGALGLILLGIGVFALREFGRNINTDRPADQVEFPFEATNVKIGKITTFWRTPDREKDQGVRLEAKLIPCATIKLQSGSGSGALRFFFVDPAGDHIGDSVTLGFSGGKFDGTGGDEADIYCTGGMADEGNYAAYLTEERDFWHLTVLEGPGPKAEGREFKEILTMRISSKRR